MLNTYLKNIGMKEGALICLNLVAGARWGNYENAKKEKEFMRNGKNVRIGKESHKNESWYYSTSGERRNMWDLWLWSMLGWHAESSDSKMRVYEVGLNLCKAKEKLRRFIFANRWKDNLKAYVKGVIYLHSNFKKWWRHFAFAPQIWDMYSLWSEAVKIVFRTCHSQSWILNHIHFQ